MVVMASIVAVFRSEPPGVIVSSMRSLPSTSPSLGVPLRTRSAISRAEDPAHQIGCRQSADECSPMADRKKGRTKIRGLYRHRRLEAVIGAIAIGGMSWGLVVLGPAGTSSATTAPSRAVSCTEGSTGITAGPYSVVCSGEAATRATIVITKATPTKFAAEVTLASGTTMESAGVSLNTGSGECTFNIGLSDGTTQPVTIEASGGALEANLDQTGGTLNPGDPSCTFKHV